MPPGVVRAALAPWEAQRPWWLSGTRSPDGVWSREVLVDRTSAPAVLDELLG